ncbi:MAG: radical SAM protein [Paludibacter sp.]|nr:radical SAM protein [Bacteroidales bacterium]MCM1069696.1 radical SAM protein [Prevotella sp.]MCM1354396.1 radical SAM protein [Bacteroides sp.]MCM1441943.1 radical SAM protein [Muribaculum sp.]MCM1482617.1 radical SAM protein [Paludibacter sp.]
MRLLTVRRLLNGWRCVCSYLMSHIGLIRIRHRPMFISVEPANRCMLHCPECPVGMGKNPRSLRLLSAELLQKVLDENALFMHTVIFHFQGEPLLNKHLPQLVRRAKSYRIYTMLSTNGQAVDAAMAEQLVSCGLDKIIVSIDGFTQSSYEAYRVGGSLQRALDAMRYLHACKVAQKASIEIELQCLRLRSNEQEWEWVQKHYKELGADRLVFKTAQFYDYEQGNPLMPSDERYCRYRKDKTGKYRLKKKQKNRCWRLWSGCVVDVDGNVLPCCFDKDRQYVLGNLFTSSLEDIWQGSAAMSFRRNLLQHRKEIDICTNCTE